VSGGTILATMTLEDLPGVLAIERASFALPWTEENFRHEIESNPHAWNVVARDDEGVAGFASAHVVAGDLMINDVAVEPSRRRQGVGRAIVRHLIEGAAARGCRRAFLEVRPTNAAALALYAELGFRRIGLRPRYYSDTGEDALVMARTLDPR